MKLAQHQGYICRRAFWAIALTATFGSYVLGQGPTHDVSAPPPIKVISSEERQQLNEARDPKTRVKLSIVLAEVHLANAEAQTNARVYDNASGEAARYWAIIENSFAYLRTMKSDSNKTRDLYKRLELALRAHGPRLLAMRRTTPSEYAVWIKEIEERARNGRTEALNSFYGQTVLRDGRRSQPTDQPAAEKPVEKPVKENTIGARPKPL